MNDLKDTIMKGVLAADHHRKARKRKEKRIIFIYLGAIFFVLLLLFFVKGMQVVSPKLQLPEIAEIEPGMQDLIAWYKLFAVVLISSLIAFGVYFVNRPKTSLL
jgi:hypothetical protein